MTTMPIMPFSEYPQPSTPGGNRDRTCSTTACKLKAFVACGHSCTTQQAPPAAHAQRQPRPHLQREGLEEISVTSTHTSPPACHKCQAPRCVCSSHSNASSQPACMHATCAGMPTALKANCLHTCATVLSSEKPKK